MRPLIVSSSLTFLLLCSACSTSPKPFVTVPQRVAVEVPDSLLERCRKKKRQPAATQVGVIIDRLRYTEDALDECGARVEAIIDWKARQRALAGKG